jgi:WD40 repeat protein
MDGTPIVLWSTTPHAGYDINSVAVSADGGVIAAGTFFHDYGAAQPLPSEASAQGFAHDAQHKIVGRMSPAATRSDVGGNQDGRYGTYVWDRAGTLLFAKEFDGWQGVYWVDVASDGGTVASCGWKSQDPYAGFIGAWSAPDGDELLAFALPGRGNMVSLDDQGQTLLAGADQGYLFHRDGDGGFNGPANIALTASGDSVVATGIASDGNTGLVASYQGEVILFRIAQGQPAALARWQLPGAAYTHYAVLSGDGGCAYAGASDGTLYAFDVADFLQSAGAAWQMAIPDGAKAIYGLACSNDGGKVAIAGNVSQGGVVAVYANAGTQATLRWTAHSAHSPNCLAFDPSGHWLALADGHPDGTPGAFYLWDARDGSLSWRSPTGNMSWPIRIAGDASVVVGGSDDGAVTVFAGPGNDGPAPRPGAG